MLCRWRSSRWTPAAQRTLNQTRAKGIFKNLVTEALGTLIVSQRANGDYYVVDGLHRKAGCEMAGIAQIACEVHEGLDQQEEAILFLIKNRESSKPNALDGYNVGLTAHLPLFTDTEEGAGGAQPGDGATRPRRPSVPLPAC